MIANSVPRNSVYVLLSSDSQAHHLIFIRQAQTLFTFFPGTIFFFKFIAIRVFCSKMVKNQTLKSGSRKMRGKCS